jgi:hypothetical protein
MTEHASASVQSRRRAPRVLRLTSIQFRRAGWRLSRLFRKSSVRGERALATSVAGKNIARVRPATGLAGRRSDESAERLSRLAAAGILARRSWQRFALLPAQHRAWTFAAVTGTSGVLLLLCWQWFGGHDAARSPEQDVEVTQTETSDSEANETSASTGIAPPSPEKTIDGIAGFLPESKNDQAKDDHDSDPFGALPAATQDASPESASTAPADTTGSDPSLTSTPASTDEFPSVDKPLEVAHPSLETKDVESHASPAAMPEFGVGLAQEQPTVKPEDAAAKPNEAAPEFPETPTNAPKENAPAESSAPLTIDDMREKVRNLLDGAATEPKQEEWNRHEESREPAPSHDAPPERTDESPKSEVLIERPISESPADEPPASEPVKPEEPTRTEPATTEPSATEPTEKKTESATESEPRSPDSPVMERAPIEEPRDPPRSSITDSAVTNVAVPQLRFTVLSPERVPLGGTCRVGFRVTNTGNVATDDVRVLFDLPQELSYRKGRALEYAVGTLAPGETREARLTARADALGSGVCRGVIQTSGERISDAEAPIAISQPQPVRNPPPVLMPAPQFYGSPAPYAPCPCGW